MVLVKIVMVILAVVMVMVKVILIKNIRDLVVKVGITVITDAIQVNDDILRKERV